MADNGFKVNKSINLNPQSAAPNNPVSGDMYFDSAIGSFAYYNQGAWACMDSIGTVASSASITSSTLTPAVVKNSIVRITGGSGNLVGMSASFAGKRVLLYNNTSGTITIFPNHTNESIANNRILTPISNSMVLISGELAQFMYDSAQQRWLLVSVGSGAGAYLPATTSMRGSVQLNSAPVDANSPVVPVIDVNGAVVATGLTRGPLANGWVTIGTGGNDLGILTAKVALTQLQPTVTTNLSACQVRIGAPDDYDSNWHSLVMLQGSKNGLSALRGAVGSAPIRFTNTGNYETPGIGGHGLITEWYAVSDAGWEQVASLSTEGFLRLNGGLRAETINCIGDFAAGTGLFADTLSTRDINVANGYNVTLTNGYLQAATVKAIDAFSYTAPKTFSKYVPAIVMHGVNTTFTGGSTTARSYWVDGGLVAAYEIRAGCNLPLDATITGLKIYGQSQGGGARTFTVRIKKFRSDGTSVSIYNTTDTSNGAANFVVTCANPFVPTADWKWTANGDCFEISVSWTGISGYTCSICGVEVQYSTTGFAPSV